MGFKKKVFGFVAAAALTLSMVGGVAAQSSDSVDGDVVLKAGLCKVNITQSEVSFGEWTWDGHQYVHDNNNVATINGTITSHRPGGTCNGTLSTGGLVGESGYIPAKHFTAGLNGTYIGNLGSHPQASTGQVAFSGAPQGAYALTIAMVSAPTDFQPDTYNGTLTVTVTNGA